MNFSDYLCYFWHFYSLFTAQKKSFAIFNFFLQVKIIDTKMSFWRCRSSVYWIPHVNKCGTGNCSTRLFRDCCYFPCKQIRRFWFICCTKFNKSIWEESNGHYFFMCYHVELNMLTALWKASYLAFFYFPEL